MVLAPSPMNPRAGTTWLSRPSEIPDAFSEPPQTYGTDSDVPSKPKKARDSFPISPCTVLCCIIWPLLIFIVVSFFRSTEIRHASNTVSIGICVLILLIILAVTDLIPFCRATCLILSAQASFGESSTRSRVTSFLAVSCILSWIFGMGCGDYNYAVNFQPFFDLTSLNTYPAVEPSIYTGAQMFDFGAIDFVRGSHLDLTRSYGFKNGDIYCVAPVISPKFANTKKPMDNYDFWAVGKNCCSGHTSDFHCGEYSNPHANKGLRLMNDEDRSYFRLAVEEAQASYNIKTSHPLFMYWMEFPQDEVHAYMEGGWKYFLHGMVAFSMFQLCLTMIAGFFFI